MTAAHANGHPDGGDRCLRSVAPADPWPSNAAPAHDHRCREGPCRGAPRRALNAITVTLPDLPERSTPEETPRRGPAPNAPADPRTPQPPPTIKAAGWGRAGALPAGR
ncbi:hypothetical protein GCM10009730_49630 [Streptomyces albidochromogenes]